MRPANAYPLSASSSRVLFRFGLRLVVLVSFAGFGTSGYVRAFLALLLMSALMCVGWALARRESLLGDSLTNWDEAAAYGCLASLLAAIAQG